MDNLLSLSSPLHRQKSFQTVRFLLHKGREPVNPLVRGSKFWQPHLCLILEFWTFLGWMGKHPTLKPPLKRTGIDKQGKGQKIRACDNKCEIDGAPEVRAQGHAQGIHLWQWCCRIGGR